MEEKNQVTELQIIQAKQAADFAMTPVGQTVKQFEIMQRMAKMYTESTIVPDTYKGNIGNCVIALDMAMRMGCNPLMCMQNLYIVHGNPAFSSKFLIATINASGRFSPLRYEFKGVEGTPDYGCRCVAYESGDKEHKEPLHGDWITIAMADKEGWTKKNGSKWQSMPSQMLRYRAAAFWQRVYCPEILKKRLMIYKMQNIPKLLQRINWLNLQRRLQELKSKRLQKPLNNQKIVQVKNHSKKHYCNGSSAHIRMVSR